jgi:uracil-DNA glycosylase
MSIELKDLSYFNSGEWQVVNERLHDLELSSTVYCPGRKRLFTSLSAVRGHPRVVIFGQDPYPNIAHCTGIAFDVPITIKDFPPTLKNIFKEYQDDLHFDAPTTGSLLPWCRNGVLLWNVFPSCLMGKPGSHHWEEWTPLSKEILQLLDQKDVVMVFLGSVAREFSRYVNHAMVLETSHPSPLGARHGFLGSRLFSTINSMLDKPIDWRLPCTSATSPAVTTM